MFILHLDLQSCHNPVDLPGQVNIIAGLMNPILVYQES